MAPTTPNQAQPTQLLYSVKDVSLLTSLSEDYVRDLVNSGELPGRRHGRRILVTASDLQTFINAMPRVGESA